MYKKFCRLSIALITILALAAPVVVYADTGEIEEIIVTARKREEPLQQVPISIAAFSAEDIEARSVSNLKELGQMTPNLNWAQHSSRGSTAGLLFIRGVGQNDPRIYWDPGVGMYVDGVYMGRMQGVDIDLVELERIEVLRGPQGTLFGKNTIGGAINVVSAKPGDELSGSAEVTLGEFNRFDVKGSFDVPLVPGKLSAKFSAATRNRDGYGSRLAFPSEEKIEDMGDVDRQSGRALFYWTPTDNFDALLSLDGTRIRQTGTVASIEAYNENAGLVRLFNILADPPFGDVFLTDSNFTSYGDKGEGNKRDLDDRGISLTAQWYFGNLSLKSITSYRDLESLNDTKVDGSIYRILMNTNIVEQNQFTQEVQLNGTSFDDRLEWVIGLYYFEESGEEIDDIPVFEPLASYPPIPGTPLPLEIGFIRKVLTDNSAYAAFGQGTYDVSDKFSITGGVRITRDEKELSRTRLLRESGTVLVPWGTRDDSWSEMSGLASLAYQWNEDLMTYFSVSRGFKSGGFSGDSVSEDDFDSFDPETIWTYEAGIKSVWYDNRLRFNAALFFSDYTDMQFTVVRASPQGAPIRIVDNAAKSEIKGFEMEIVAQPTSGLRLEAGIGYTDAKYTKVDPTIGITTDTKFNSIPKWTVMLAGEYAAPLRDWGELIGRVDYVYKSKTNFDSLNSPFLWQQSYGLVNARLTLQPQESNWYVSLFGTNLTDEEYFLGGTDLFNNLGIAARQWMQPREWGISLGYRF